jgi:hypothetical protein
MAAARRGLSTASRCSGTARPARQR